MHLYCRPRKNFLSSIEPKGLRVNSFAEAPSIAGLGGLGSKIKVSRICGNTYLKELSVLPLSSYQIQKALRRNILAGSLGTVFGVATTGTFLIGYTLRLGASPFQIGSFLPFPFFATPSRFLPPMFRKEEEKERKPGFLGTSPLVLLDGRSSATKDAGTVLGKKTGNPEWSCPCLFSSFGQITRCLSSKR